MTGRAKIVVLLAALAAGASLFAADAVAKTKTYKDTPKLPPRSAPKETTYEEKSVKAFGLYCLTALAREDTVGHFAAMNNLIQIPPKGAKSFLAGKPGKVFALPDVGPGIALVVPDGPSCSIMLQRLDENEFVRQVSALLDPARTVFRLKNNEMKPGDTTRAYEGKVGRADIAIIFRVRAPRVFGAQAVIMAVRADSNAKTP